MPAFGHPLLALLCSSVVGCATQSANAPRESLDERTGTTISNLDAPLQLLATEPGAPSADPFAFAAPFETNRMGSRALYLWVSVPGEGVAPPTPRLRLDDAPLELPLTASEPAALGLVALPYTAPAPWSAIYIFTLDAATLRQLEAGRTMSIDVQYSRAGAMRFAGIWDGGGAIAAFRRRLGLRD